MARMWAAGAEVERIVGRSPGGGLSDLVTSSHSAVSHAAKAWRVSFLTAAMEQADGRKCWSQDMHTSVHLSFANAEPCRDDQVRHLDYNVVFSVLLFLFSSQFQCILQAVNDDRVVTSTRTGCVHLPRGFFILTGKHERKVVTP